MLNLLIKSIGASRQKIIVPSKVRDAERKPCSKSHRAIGTQDFPSSQLAMEHFVCFGAIDGIKTAIEVANERSSGLRVFGISPRVVAPPRWSRKRYLNIETALKAKDVHV